MQKLDRSCSPGVFRKPRALSPAAGDERPAGEISSHRLKALGGRRGATGTTSPSNNSDAALTAVEQAGRNLRVSAVYVLNMRGEPLMPCSPGRARRLLDEGRAKVDRRTPFTIRLTRPSGETVQPVALGFDCGYSGAGVSAVTNGKELYSAEVELRSDMVKLISERRQYRRGRRYRKTWHRKSRFLNRRKPEGWLAPSVRHKLDSHLKAVEKAAEILPVSEIRVEVASFDIQRIKNPGISGDGYQNGPQRDFWNVREYVLFRDGHKCKQCRGKEKDPVLQVHHIESRHTGGDRPDNLITLCRTCHGNVSKGVMEFKAKPGARFRAETFMTTVRRMLIDELKTRGYEAKKTYGYITKGKRIALGIPKSHANDAFVIAGGKAEDRRAEAVYSIKQARKCNRKLYRGSRSHIRNTGARFIKGFQRFDRVLWKGEEGFVFGRRTSGYFDIRKLDGEKLSASANFKSIRRLESASTFLTERRESGSSLRQEHRVSAACKS